MSWNFSIFLFDDFDEDCCEEVPEEMKPLFSRREEEDEYEEQHQCQDERTPEHIAELEQMRELNLKEAQERENKKKNRHQRREEKSSWTTVAKSTPKKSIAPTSGEWISPKDLQCQNCRSTQFLELVLLIKNKPIHSILCAQCRGQDVINALPVKCKCGWDKNARLTTNSKGSSIGFEIQCHYCSNEKGNTLEMTNWNCTQCNKMILYTDKMLFKINPGFNEKPDLFLPICEGCSKP